MLVFSLFILLAMLLAIGMAIDTARVELDRARLQTVTDNAILAAADLEQGLDPTEVVNDYYRKAGLENYHTEPVVESSPTFRTVSATARSVVPTLLMKMVGIHSLVAPAAGTATESMSDVEIALVLDVSGSMDDTTPTRISLLKPAARSFIDTVTRQEDDPGTTVVSIVPFSSQVSLGEGFLARFDNTGEHSYSSCVTFEAGDFQTTGISLEATLTRTAHYYAISSSLNPTVDYLVCPPSGDRAITPWSRDADHLKGRIDALQVYGNTSIEIGTKWGAALLDPSLRPILNAMELDGEIDAALRDQPFDYSRENTMKILVVMSDGENTGSGDIKPPYRAGPSALFRHIEVKQDWVSTGGSKGFWRTTKTPHYSYFDEERAGTAKYYSVDDDAWKSGPDGGSEAVRLTWPEVWDDMAVRYFTRNIKRKALGGDSATYDNEIKFDLVGTDKNPRTSDICSAAKAAGVTIFTIGMDTYGNGDTTLADCASMPSYFYDVKSLDIASAFASIARQINQLRLTQ
ncbi:pilus assembly protein TadG-related protein [Tropicimonas sp.]|uniref:pilus assembly protein TadG-related protein n=1 Tax=Tropicimonas sp. TaxID=2067044 RepID=UPI003A87A357